MITAELLVVNVYQPVLPSFIFDLQYLLRKYIQFSNAVYDLNGLFTFISNNLALLFQLLLYLMMCMKPFVG